MGSRLLAALLCLHVATSAGSLIRDPDNSDITIIQIKPIVSSGSAGNVSQHNYRSSRIENLQIKPPIDSLQADLARLPRSSEATETPAETTSPDPTSAETTTKRSHTNKLYKNKYAKKHTYGDLEEWDPAYRKYVESRRFRSRCRCERIWNCPKLQLSVPRCPAEYFMCCF